MKRVVDTFLESGNATLRQDLVAEFQSLIDVDDLVHRQLFRAYPVNSQPYLPAALAFHFCGDASIEDEARRAVQVLARVLRKQFLQRQTDLSREALEEDARKIDQHFDRKTIELGIYLAPDFGLFQSYLGGNAAEPKITPTQISERIVEIKDPDSLWDNHMRTCKPWPDPALTEESESPVPQLELDSNQRDLERAEPVWTRDQKIASLGVVVTIAAIFVGAIVAVTVPEVREQLHLEEPITPVTTASPGEPGPPAPYKPPALAPNSREDRRNLSSSSSKSSSAARAAPLFSGRIDWHNKQNWRAYLMIGMSKNDVRSLFGDPEHVWVSSDLEEWGYGRGSVTFASGKLWQWSEPD